MCVNQGRKNVKQIWFETEYCARALSYQPKDTLKILGILFRFSDFIKCYLIFETEIMRKICDKHFQIYNWLAEPKHLQDIF
jgi:hypothetical protein